jgi:PAS domain S-box-containing protein
MSSRLFEADLGGAGSVGEDNTSPERVASLEDELRSLENLHRCVLANIQSALVQLDEKGAITDCNARFEEVAGTTLESLRSMRWEVFVAEEDRDRLRGFFRDRTRATGSVPSSYTFRFISSDGVSRLMQANAGLIPESGARVVSLTDLSEIVKAQHRTAESEDRYRTAVENTLDGILICREDTVLFANATFCDLTGWTREMVYSMNPLQLFHHGDRNRLITLLRDSVGSGAEASVLFEAMILRKDGTDFPGEVSPVRIAFRGSRATLLTIRDLTQRKLAERQMKENHTLFKAIVDNSPVAISVHDRNGTLLMANGAWRTIWGKTEADQEKLMLPREKLRMDRRDNYLAGYMTAVEKVYREGGELLIPQLRIFNPPPGGAEWISHHFYAIEDEKGDVDKVVVLTLDLTEFFRTREQLEQSEGQYRELVENTPVAIYRTSIEDGGKLLSVNPEMLRLFSIPGHEGLAGIKVDSFYVDEERRREFLEAISRGDAVENFEAELRRADDTTFLASISARGRYDRDGNLTCVEGIIRDITSTRRVELDAQRGEMLESLGALAGEIAHDFNNLLTGIQGDIDLAMADLDESCPSAHLKRAGEAVEEATDLARQLHTFSGGGVPSRQPMQVEQVLRDAAETALRDSGVTAEFQIAGDIGPVLADISQISQVIRNLTLYAVKILPEGATVAYSAERLRIPTGQSHGLNAGEYVLIRVKDDGPGIPLENQTMVFHPYSSTRSGASGLGLAICYSIIRRHGGTIELSSEPGRGTEFRITIPVFAAGSRTDGQATSIDPPTDMAPGLKILVMEDTPLVREVLSGMLGKLGYRVVECAVGEEAVRLYSEALATSDPFALAILDLTIPGGTGGVRTMELLREIDPGVRAVVSSGYTQDPVLADYHRYGFTSSLSKPFTIEVLGECVSAVLSTPAIDPGRSSGGEQP